MQYNKYSDLFNFDNDVDTGDFVVIKNITDTTGNIVDLKIVNAGLTSNWSDFKWKIEFLDSATGKKIDTQKFSSTKNLNKFLQINNVLLEKEKIMISLKEGQRVLSEDGDIYEIEKGDVLQEGNQIANAVGDGMYYLISLIIDIYNNQDIINYDDEIRIIKDITSVHFSKLLTKSIRYFAEKPGYNIGVKDYIKMANELESIVDVNSVIHNVNRLEKIYYS